MKVINDIAKKYDNKYLTTTYTFTKKTHHAISKIVQRSMVFVTRYFAHGITNDCPWKLDIRFTFKENKFWHVYLRISIHSLKGKSVVLQDDK